MKSINPKLIDQSVDRRMSEIQDAAFRKTRRVLIRDILVFAGIPVAVTWVLYFALGGGLPWPFLPTFLGLVWAWMVWVRWNIITEAINRAQARDDAPVQDIAEVPIARPNEEVALIPRIRFTDEDVPTDSFIDQLNKPRDEEA